MKKILIIVSFFFISFSSFASGNLTAKYSQANELYKKGQYDTAAIVYEQIIKSGQIAPEVYFNLANSYFKAKRLPEAILNYERAKKLAPSDEAITFNLQLAQTMIVDKINVLPDFFIKQWLKAFANWFSSDSWALISIILFISSLVLIAVYLFSSVTFTKKITFWIGFASMIICLVAFACSYYQKTSYIKHNEAIVMSASVTIKSSPDENGNDLFVIHEGTKVLILDEVGEWREIKIADGSRGWIKIRDVERI